MKYSTCVRQRTLTLRRWWRAGPGLKKLESDHDYSHDFNGDHDEDGNYDLNVGDGDGDENDEGVPTFN